MHDALLVNHLSRLQDRRVPPKNTNRNGTPDLPETRDTPQANSTPNTGPKTMPFLGLEQGCSEQFRRIERLAQATCDPVLLFQEQPGADPRPEAWRLTKPSRMLQDPQDIWLGMGDLEEANLGGEGLRMFYTLQESGHNPQAINQNHQFVGYLGKGRPVETPEQPCQRKLNMGMCGNRDPPNLWWTCSMRRRSDAQTPAQLRASASKGAGSATCRASHLGYGRCPFNLRSV